MSQVLARQKGMTLIEVSIAISVFLAFLTGLAPMYIKLTDKALSFRTSERVRLVYDGAYNHYIDLGSWPASTNALVIGGYVVGSASVTSWGNPITLTPSGSNLLLSFSVPAQKYVEMVSGKLPAPAIAGTTLTETLSPPGQQASLMALQDLAGTRSWTGDYNADGHSLLELDYLDANYAILKNTYTEGASCTTKQIGTTSTGELLNCVSGQWKKAGSSGSPANMIAYFNQSSCPSGWTRSDGLNGTRDLRGAFIRALDNGRGLDPGRTLGSYQQDRMQRITASVRSVIEGSRGIFGSTSGAFRRSSVTGNAPEGGSFPTSAGRILTFDNSLVARTGTENNPKNVALLACQKLP